MMLSAKYVLSSLLLGMTAIPSIVGDETPMIIGGNDADPGEYPYYVSLNGCGGILIAPDMVLTAAHCEFGINDPDTDIYVGAYRRDNADGLAQVRRCESFKIHPQYDDYNIYNDVALCKLNDPVVIDQSMAIELNEEPLFPSAGDDLTAIGLGITNLQGTTTPEVLQHVEIPYVSNDVCADLLSPATLTENMLCAGHLSSEGTSVNDEGSCKGDSGGPLVHIDGGVHTVVGVVSWGVAWCTLVDKPGVYQRVSQHVGWIKRNACNMGSSADFCDEIPPTDSPTPYPTGFAIQDNCGAGNGGLRFRATLVTDDYPDENTISSYSFNQDYTALDKLIFYNNDLTEDNTKYYFPSDDKYYCLEKDRCYYFEVTDSYGDGIYENIDPIFEGFLGKQQKFKGAPNFGNVATKIFCTGNVCKDKKAFKIGKKKQNCKKYVTGGLNAMKRKCNKIYRGGDPVHKHCPETCGRKAGVGACHWWKGMKEKLKEKAVFDLDLDASAFHQKNRGN